MGQNAGYFNKANQSYSFFIQFLKNCLKNRYTRNVKLLGNLRTTTKFTTTTSVDWERTGTRMSVSAGKRKLKIQSIGRSTTTTLNVNKQVEVVEL